MQVSKVASKGTKVISELFGNAVLKKTCRATLGASEKFSVFHIPLKLFEI